MRTIQSKMSSRQNLFRLSSIKGRLRLKPDFDELTRLLLPSRLILAFLLPQKTAQFHARLVQLRLRSSHGTAQHSGNFLVFVALDVVKREHRPVSGRKLRNGLVERDAVDDGHRVWVFGPFYYLRRCFAVLSRLLHAHTAFTEMHEHLIDCEPV